MVPIAKALTFMNKLRRVQLTLIAACAIATPFAQHTPSLKTRTPSAPPTPPPALIAPAGPTAEPRLRSAATLHDIGDPTPEEQLYIELINRARANPVAESLLFANTTDPDVLSAYDFFNVDLQLLLDQFAAIAPAPPLAPNAQLAIAARRHSQDMFDNSFQGHTGTDGTSTGQRATQSGYIWQIIAENVYANAENVFHGHAGFEVDWGFGTGGMQTPPGHRNTIHDVRFREIGVGVVLGRNQSEPGSTIPGALSEVGPQVVTQEFGTRQSGTPLITGVAYFDLNGNNFYDIGEGIGGVNVSVSGTTTQAITARSGGYAVPVGGNGTYTVTFSGPNVTSSSQQVTVASLENEKIDFRPTYTPPALSGTTSPAVGQPNNYTTAPVPGASAYQLRSFELTTPAVEGAEFGTSTVTINQIGNYEVFETTTKKNGTYSFHLATPAGDPQSFTLNHRFLVSQGTTLRFQSRLGWAASDTEAVVEISTDNGLTWEKVYVQNGTDTAGETSFNARSANLSPYAGQIVQIRFAFRPNLNYYPQTDSTVGWFIDDILVDGGQQIANEQLRPESTTPTFTFQPTIQGAFVLQARARTGHDFLPWGPMLNVQSVVGTTPAVFIVSSFSVQNGRAFIEVELQSGTAPTSWTLQSKSTLTENWATASTTYEVLSPTSIRFNVLLRSSDPQQFYRVVAN